MGFKYEMKFASPLDTHNSHTLKLKKNFFASRSPNRKDAFGSMALNQDTLAPALETKTNEYPICVPLTTASKHSDAIKSIYKDKWNKSCLQKCYATFPLLRFYPCNSSHCDIIESSVVNQTFHRSSIHFACILHYSSSYNTNLEDIFEKKNTDRIA